MNSKQRRQDRRLWRHLVLIDDVLYDDYHAMWDWTSETFGNNSPWWRESHHHIGTRWEFKREREALIFRLKWGGNYELRSN